MNTNNGWSRDPNEFGTVVPLDDLDASGRIAIFDVDRTLLTGSSMAALARVLVRAGVLSPRALAGAAVRELLFSRFGSSDATATRLRERALVSVAGLERRDMLRLVDDVAADLMDMLRPSVSELLDQHLALGDFVVLLSAAPQELVDALAAQVGAHRGVGTRAEVVDGRYTGALDGVFCYGAGKLIRLAEAVGDVDLSRGVAYADSASDAGVLSAVGSPVVVCPDGELKRIARQRGWPVLLH